PLPAELTANSPNSHPERRVSAILCPHAQTITAPKTQELVSGFLADSCCNEHSERRKLDGKSETAPSIARPHVPHGILPLEGDIHLRAGERAEKASSKLVGVSVVMSLFERRNCVGVEGPSGLQWNIELDEMRVARLVS